MRKIQESSYYFIIAFNFLMISLPLFLTIQWSLIALQKADLLNTINFFGILEKTISTPAGMVDLKNSGLPPLLSLVGFIADLIQTSPFLISLFFLKKLFSHYKNGEIFSDRNAILYRNLAILYLIDALFIKSFGQTLMILAVTMANPPGSRYLCISFGTPNLMALFYGVIILTISWVMLESSKLHDEQSFTI